MRGKRKNMMRLYNTLCEKTKKLWELIKNDWRKYLKKAVVFIIKCLIIILSISSITLIIGLMMEAKKIFPIGGNEDAWLGYWGSIVGIMGAYVVLKVQMRSENKKHKGVTVDNTFFNLLNLHNEVLKENEKIMKKINSDIEEKQVSLLIGAKNKLVNEYVLNKSDEFIGKVSQLPNEFEFTGILNDSSHNKIPIKLNPIQDIFFAEQKIKDYLNGYALYSFEIYNKLIQNFYVYTHEESTMSYKNNSSILSFTKQELKKLREVRSTYYEQLKEMGIVHERDEYRIRFNETLKIDFTNYTNGIEKDIKIIVEDMFRLSDVSKIEISDEAISKSVNDVFEVHLVNMGYYFRIFHRIVKFLNESYKDKYITEKQLNNYIGILRAMINEHTMSLIYYNATYLEKGGNMKQELQKNFFFGNKNDFKDEARTNTFLSNKTLLFDNDYDKLKGLTKAFK